jgi:acyl-CoA synthetase (AMP-forming)/AMP-acid ligase II
LASSLSFDPCLSDIIATFYSGGCLCLCSKEKMKMDLGYVLSVLDVTHVLCTPSLWNSVNITKTAVATHTNDNVTTNTITHNATNDNCDHELDTDKDNDLLNCLEVVALGGEVMSGRIKGCWARTRRIISSTKSAEEVDICDDKSNRIIKNGSVRLLSTYGVTEACVYQTVGEVFIEEDNVERDNSVGYDIGSPMEGTKVRICKESNIVGNSDAEENVLVDVDETTNGEIVLSGNQLDEYSGYLNLPELTKKKFIQVKSNRCVEYFYRTGDRGLINPNSGRVHILGRIDGEEGMIKISGVRVELGEIEHAILDSESFSSSSASRSMVIGCIVVAHTVNEDGDKKLVAYCVLSDDCLKEMGITEFKNEDQGLLCSPGSLVAVLRARCEQAIRKECIPSTYVLIPRIPLTRTGKRNRKALPKLESCQLIDSFINGPGDSTSIRLDKYGRCGKFVYNILIECLNLQSKQRDIVTTKANFAMLGGDSLGATLVVRTLYATHHEVNNSRHLGGSFGSFDGPFHVCHLLQSMTLGDYIDFLDSNGVIDKAETAEIDLELNKVGTTDVTNGNQNKELLLYESLVEAITLGQSIVAASLISVGADPNYDDHGRRLGKMKNGRKEQKRLLKSNPLHLACVKGDQYLVSALLNSGCNCKSPDAAGQYPLHLACSGGASGVHDMDQVNEQDTRRLECVRLLLEVGKAPLAMKNVSKQTVLHCAARAGHCRLLKYLMDTWGNNETIKANKLWGSKFDWQDRWFRTPVHWAVLNGKVAALKLLLEYCSPNPPLPKQSSKRSSVATESPLQICERLYDIESDIGKEIRQLLTNSR